MLSIKCPRCGTVTGERERGFPRCKRCSTYLYRCGLCRHHLHGSCGHPLVPPGVKAEREAIPICGLFDPAAAARASAAPGRWPGLVWSYLAVAALAAGAIWVAAMLFTPTSTPPSGLAVSMVRQPEIVESEGSGLSMEVSNLSKQPIPQLTVRIGSQCFRLLEVPPEGISPPPKQVYADPGTGDRYLVFGGLAPGARLPIEIGLRPVKQGRCVLSLDVFSNPAHASEHLEYRVQAVPSD